FLLASATFAHADAKGPGVSLGLRLGYAIPMGKAGAGAGAMAPDLKDEVKSMIPIQVDVGYRFNPNIYLGGSVQYAFAQLNTDKKECDGCSAKDLTFGVNVAYHISPDASFDPWVGAGVGYETTKLSLGGIDASVKG